VVGDDTTHHGDNALSLDCDGDGDDSLSSILSVCGVLFIQESSRKQVGSIVSCSRGSSGLIR